MKKVQDMTKKELLQEYQGIKQQIEELSFGSRDLRYQAELEREIDKRGYTIHKKYSF